MNKIYKNEGVILLVETARTLSTKDKVALENEGGV
jgi:hypothetical protein